MLIPRLREERNSGPVFPHRGGGICGYNPSSPALGALGIGISRRLAFRQAKRIGTNLLVQNVKPSVETEKRKL